MASIYPTGKPLRGPLDNRKQIGTFRVTLRTPEIAKTLRDVKERVVTFLRAGKPGF